MKGGLGRIALIVVAILGVLGFFWTMFTTSSNEDAAVKYSENMDNTGITFFLIIGIISVVITVGLFLLYKVLDLSKHPKHLKELLLIIGIVLVTFVIGLIFGGGETLMDVKSGTEISSFKSRMIGASIVSFIILLAVSFGYLIFDTIRGMIKN